MSFSKYGIVVVNLECLAMDLAYLDLSPPFWTFFAAVWIDFGGLFESFVTFLSLEVVVVLWLGYK